MLKGAREQERWALLHAQGRVKWYSANLGHGFILPDDGGVELPVVHKEIVGGGIRTLNNKTRVI